MSYSGFELSGELVETLCRAHGVEYNKNYSYTIRDVPGGVQMRISDPLTGDEINNFTTYSAKNVDSGFADVEKDVLRVRKENSYVKQCILIIYAIMFFGVIAAVMMILGVNSL